MVPDPLQRPAHSYSIDGMGAPSTSATIATLNYRVQQLERRAHLSDSITPDVAVETAVWGRETPTVSTSPVYRVRIGGLLYVFYIDLRVTASSGSTTCHLYLDGVDIGNASISAGNYSATLVLNTAVNSGANLYVDCTAVGIDAEGLSAQARFS